VRAYLRLLREYNDLAREYEHLANEHLALIQEYHETLVEMMDDRDAWMARAQGRPDPVYFSRC